MKTSEVLYGAAYHIERYGHHKGDPFAGGLKSAACAHGAISAASLTLGREPLSPARFEARNALRTHIGTGNISGWNDAPERTADEVIAALKACAVIEAARETVSGRERVES